MSLTAEAIDRIGSLALAADNPLASAIGEQAVALPESMRIQDLEKFMPVRRRFRGSMETEQIGAFCEYTEAQGEAEVFIDTDGMCAIAYFDMGTRDEPGHCEHRAAVSLKQTAAYCAMKKINGQVLNQRELADWLEDWGRHVQCFDSEGEDMHIVKALASVRKMTIETARKLESEEKNMGRQLSAMERIEVSSEGKTLGGFYFTCTPHNGFQERTFRLPLSALTGGDNIRLKLRVQELEAIQEEIAEEFRIKVEGHLTGEGFNVWMGAFKA
ncbi:DUF2303 family protein [Marinobacterium sp. MBR-109]|jgi:uncharacterized protein YfdQ (DUF2303 family)|uniref:DUF2303 family protein n=1 Tax=Marinobacterium sp. MBR-109 TaxID=3156462 RepID=UPI0033958430